MSPPDDESPPWRSGTPHDSLNRFTSLLGTFILKESEENAETLVKKALVPRHDTLSKLLAKEATEDSLSFPCLSLVSEHDTGLRHDTAVAKAALSMAIPVTLTPVGKKAGKEFAPPKVSLLSTGKHVESSTGVRCQHPAAGASCHTSREPMTPAAVPMTMLNNLAASFALLVEARLRAYTTILARHGVALAVSPDGEQKQEAICAVERKLDSLLDIGSRITIDNIVTNFQPQSKLAISRTVDGVEETMMPLIMSAIIDLSVPREIDGHERVTVPLQASGAIAGSCVKGSTLLKSVRLELDTQQLMSAMVDRAARVSSIALDHVNNSSCRHVAAAMLSLKTALPEKRSKPSQDLILPVVSPDLCTAMLPLNGPTPLTLDEKDNDDGPELTPECCASIVDDCFGEIKDCDLLLSPPAKRMRMEDTLSVPPAVL